jgi:hypothetical protein
MTAGTMPGMLECFRVVEFSRDGALILGGREVERDDPGALAPIRTAIRVGVGPYGKAAIGTAGEIDPAAPVLGIAPTARRRFGGAEQADIAAFRRPHRNAETKLCSVRGELSRPIGCTHYSKASDHPGLQCTKARRQLSQKDTGDELDGSQV